MHLFARRHGLRLFLILPAVLLAGSFTPRASAQTRTPLNPHAILARQPVPPIAPLIDLPVLTAAQVADDELVPDTATVTFAAGVSPPVAENLINSIGVAIMATVPKLATYEVKLPAGMSIEQGIAALSALPGASRAEPAVQLHADFQPTDPLYNRYQTPYLQLIHAEQAWDIQLGNPNIIVAVLDSGVDITHPDLQSQIWTNPNPGQSGCGNDLHGCNFVDPARVDATCSNQNPTPAPNPDVMSYPTGKLGYHGTFVAGIIAAGINNAAGIAGIAPHVSIMPVRVGDCTKPYDTAVANGLLYAADNGAVVINLSIGGGCTPWPSFIIEAIRQVERRGVVVVAAAGNEHRPCVDAPANVAGVIAVSATNATGLARADFSSWGPQVAVSAPGVNIISTVPHRDRQEPNDYYSLDDGTSFAAPIVSGLAALLLSQNPLLTPDWVKYLIQAGATPLADAGQPGWSGAGRIDLAGSLLRVPAAIYGRATQDGTAVPDGTPVQAYVGNSICGDGSTYTANGESVYLLFVAAATDQAGCGATGATVTMVANGIPAASTPFKPAATALDLAARG